MSVPSDNRTSARPVVIPRSRPFTVPGEWSFLRQHFSGEAPLSEQITRDWEVALAEFLGAPGAACVNSGRQGMALIMQHLNLRVGDEVIVPAYTLRDLVPLIERYGAKVLPADIDPNTLFIDPARVAERITPRTRAILVWHAFGTPAPIADLCALAKDHDIAVVEDCAHALGARVDNRPVGTHGYAAFFSFEPGRPVNTYGGGMVVSADAALLDHVRRENNRHPLNLDRLQLKVNTIIREQYLMQSGLGLPLLYGYAKPLSKRVLKRVYTPPVVPSEHNRYAPVQAHLGLEKLPHVAENRARRETLVAHYEGVLPGMIAPRARSKASTPTYAQYVVRLPREAEKVRTQLLWRGIDAAAGDELGHDVATPLGYDDCPHAANVARSALGLPLFEGLTGQMIDRVARALTKALES